jgi:glutathione S-transferase
MTEVAALYVLNVSPWSERARWALDHHGVAYRTVEHAPMLGERRLRRIVGRRDGRVTVPVLVAGDRVLADSWDIAAHADRVGTGAPLIPAAHEAGIRQWTRDVDEAAGQARALVTAAMLASPEALDEALPPEVPRWFAPLARPAARYVTRWFARKYALRLDAAEEHEQAVRRTLQALRERLAGSDGLMFGEFTFADIVSATLLQGVRPVDDAWLPLGPATRAAWTRPALAEAFADLIAWRDALYRDRRAATAGHTPRG